MTDYETDRPESRYLRRFEALKHERVVWEDEWQDVTRFVFPRRNGWDRTTSPDKVGASEIYDGTALAALTLMTDGLLGHLVPASIPFFRLKPSIPRFEDFAPLRTWLDDCQLHILSALERSNFYEALGEAFPDAGSLGTAVMYMEEDISSGRVYFSTRHLKECFVAENRWGLVDTIYRRFEMTLDQLVEQFESSLEERMKDRAKRNPDDKVTVLHAVEPGKTRKFDSTYILLDANAKKDSKILDEGGYDFFPYIVWRFRKNSDEVYGRSPAMDALYDVEMINHQAKSMAEAAQKAIDPPLMANGTMRGRIRKNPGEVTYFDNMNEAQVRQLYGAGMAQYPLGIDAMERRAKIIREHFRSDFFSYLLGTDARQRTATEVNAIEAQKAAVLGSTIGRINKELFEPVVHNMFSIEYQAKRLPPVPREVAPLMGLNLEIEYTGPLAQKQRQYLQSEGVLQGSAAVMGVAQARPDVLDNFDWDKIALTAATANGMPKSAELDPRLVQKMRLQRAQAQAAMQQAQFQLEAAKVNPALAKAPEPGSPAEKMQGAQQ